jgi:hypothetical protein
MTETRNPRVPIEGVVPIITSVGHAGIHDYAVRDKMLYRDMGGRTSFLALLSYGLAGVELNALEVQVMDELALCVYVPEPRVWPLKLGRIAASYGRPATGLAVAMLALDGNLIGANTASQAAHDLSQLCAATEKLDAATLDAQLDAYVGTKPRLAGFGVPGRPADERLVALLASLSRLDVLKRPHTALAHALLKKMLAAHSVEANIALFIAAICLDLGFKPEHVTSVTLILMSVPVITNALEGALQQAPSLVCLPIAALDYRGVAPRVSPRSAASQSK